MNKRPDWTPIIDVALAEDLGEGDLTSHLLIPKGHTSQGSILLKAKAVICGVELARDIFRRVDPKISFQILSNDGTTVLPGRSIAKLKGKTRGILAAERVALNFLGQLSAISTKTRAFTDAVKPYRCEILDTRKTTPGLRDLERYAVRCGGGVNHRDRLDSMILIKDNHWTALVKTSMFENIQNLRKLTDKKIEVEVDTLTQFQSALEAKPDFILLDNMNMAQLKKAVALYQKHPNRTKIRLEASGGINLQNVKRIAATGVHRISVGELTHSRQAIDFSLELSS